MTSHAKVEKVKNRHLGATQNLAKFFHFSSVKVHMSLKIVKLILICHILTFIPKNNTLQDLCHLHFTSKTDCMSDFSL